MKRFNINAESMIYLHDEELQQKFTVAGRQNIRSHWSSALEIMTPCAYRRNEVMGIGANASWAARDAADFISSAKAEPLYQ